MVPPFPRNPMAFPGISFMGLGLPWRRKSLVGCWVSFGPWPAIVHKALNQAGCQDAETSKGDSASRDQGGGAGCEGESCVDVPRASAGMTDNERDVLTKRLLEALLCCNYELIYKLLETGADPDNKCDFELFGRAFHCDSMLPLAVMQGSVDIVQLLVQVRSSAGRTPCPS